MDLDPRLVIEEREDVYRPSEDSRLLLAAISLRAGERFLEVGTGSGFVAVHAARFARVVATDANPGAAHLARANALRNRVSMAVLTTDLMAGIRGTFDVIAFNPPYLEGPATDRLDRAWQGGRGGSEIALRFLGDLDRVLAPRGRAYLLLSRVNEDARAAAEARYQATIAATQKLFFETLDVLKLRRRGPSRASRTSRPSGHSQGP